MAVDIRAVLAAKLPGYPDDNLLDYMSSMLEENNEDLKSDMVGFLVEYAGTAFSPCSRFNLHT